MEIESVDTLRSIINNQNKTIEFLYKEQAQHVEQINEKQEQLDAIFNWIAELYDIIEEWEIDYWTIDWTSFILEELARIQNYCK